MATLYKVDLQGDTFKSAEDLKLCVDWYKHTFMPIVSNAPNSEIYSWDYGEFDWTPEMKQPYIKVFDCMKTQDIDAFGKLDEAFNLMSGVLYSDRCFGEYSNSDVKVEFSPFALADVLARICNKLNITWKNYSKQEFIYFTKTIFGKALLRHNCFATNQTDQSNEPDTTANTVNNNQSQSHSATQAQNANNQQPSNNATQSNTNITPQLTNNQQVARATGVGPSKAHTKPRGKYHTPTAGTELSSPVLGPRTKVKHITPFRANLNGWSDEASGLISKPHEKRPAKGQYVWKIRDAEMSKLIGHDFRALIRPLDHLTDSNGNNVIQVSAYRNEGVAALWFDDENLARDFMNAIQPEHEQAITAKNYYTKDGDKITGKLVLAREEADENGYFDINTNYGPAMIRAFNLNEDIDNANNTNDEDEKKAAYFKDMKELSEELNDFLG